MNNVNKTLYIPLFGKSYVSQRGLFINDKKAEQIWASEGFSLKGRAKSKWLAYYMGVRCAVFDDWLREQMKNSPDATVIHIGCGMDSRITRVGATCNSWYDVDFPDVIKERKRYYNEADNYKMIAGDVREADWLSNIKERKRAIVVMEGVSMYMSVEEMRGLADNLCERFESVALLVDSYTTFGAKMSKIKNPVRAVGVTEVYGIDNPKDYQGDRLIFIKEHAMTPQRYIDELKGAEKLIFSKLYAGTMSKKLYRLFEYKSN